MWVICLSLSSTIVKKNICRAEHSRNSYSHLVNSQSFCFLVDNFARSPNRFISWSTHPLDFKAVSHVQVGWESTFKVMRFVQKYIWNSFETTEISVTPLVSTENCPSATPKRFNRFAWNNEVPFIKDLTLLVERWEVGSDKSDDGPYKFESLLTLLAWRRGRGKYRKVSKIAWRQLWTTPSLTW